MLDDNVWIKFNEEGEEQRREKGRELSLFMYGWFSWLVVGWALVVGMEWMMQVLIGFDDGGMEFYGMS
jgi:hypothetical protein